MIGYVKGVLAHKQEGMVIVECNGVGYELFVSNNTLAELPYSGEECKLFSYLHVKEDGVCLYGFASMEEKELFNKIISVSGIGPKGAIGLLSGMNLAQLSNAIATSNVNELSKIKGLGKKTAERLCLELKDKIGIQGAFDDVDISNVGAMSDAIEVLVSLGITKNEATALAKRVAKADMAVEEIISLCLQQMGR